MAGYGKTQFRAAIAEETTLGTAITNDASFQELHLTEPYTLPTAEGLIIDETPRMDGSAVPMTTDEFRTKKGGVQTCQVTGVFTRKIAPFLLYGVMQNVSEAAITPYLKTLTWNRDTAVLHGDPNKFYTLALHDPIAAEGKRLKSCPIRTLELRWDSQTARWMYTATFVTGFGIETGLTHDPSSWTDPGTSYFTTSDLETKTLGGAALITNSISISFDNGATPYGVDSNGYCEGYSIGIAGGKGYVCTGSVNAIYNSTTKDLLDKVWESPAGGSADMALVLEMNDGEINELTFAGNVVLDSADFDTGQDSGVMRTLPFKCKDDGTNSAMVATIADEVDHSW